MPAYLPQMRQMTGLKSTGVLGYTDGVTPKCVDRTTVSTNSDKV